MTRKTLSKIIISSLILAMVSVIFFLPEQNIAVLRDDVADDGAGYNIIGERQEVKDYGTIDVNETGKHGYGYIGNKEKQKGEFGLIEFENALDDSVFTGRVKIKFLSDDIRVYKTSGISYALIDGKHIYIENTGISEVAGFNGPIDLAVVVNTEGVLDSVIYLSSEETPSYLNRVFKAGYFSQFDDMELDEQHIVDAVSGATITTVAVAGAVSEILMLSQRNILDDYMSGNAAGFNVKAELNKIWIFNLLILVLLFGLLRVKRFRKRNFLTIIAVFTIVWLGFYLNSSFTYLLFIKAFTTPGLSVFTIAYILLVLSSTVWFRNTYCKYICPFGNAQKLVYKFSPVKNRKTVFKNKHLKNVRYVVSIFVVVGYLSGFEILSEYELFPYFFGVNASHVMFGISVFVVLTSMRIPNLWCRALCPTGCVLDTLSDVSENKFSFKNIVTKN